MQLLLADEGSKGAGADRRHLMQFGDISPGALRHTIAHCRRPKPAGQRHCEALRVYLYNCRHRFGAATLRCNRDTATACVSGKHHVREGRCGRSLADA